MIQTVITGESPTAIAPPPRRRRLHLATPLLLLAGVLVGAIFAAQYHIDVHIDDHSGKRS